MKKIQFLLVSIMVLFSFSCGVRGEPTRRQDEVFIRQSRVIEEAKEQSTVEKSSLLEVEASFGDTGDDSDEAESSLYKKKEIR